MPQSKPGRDPNSNTRRTLSIHLKTTRSSYIFKATLNLCEWKAPFRLQVSRRLTDQTIPQSMRSPSASVPTTCWASINTSLSLRQSLLSLRSSDHGRSTHWKSATCRKKTSLAYSNTMKMTETHESSTRSSSFSKSSTRRRYSSSTWLIST